MAGRVEKRKSTKLKKKEDDETMHPGKPTKEEIAVAKWVRANVATKKTKFLSHSVEYFTASKAIDKLLESPWSVKKKDEEQAMFHSREAVVLYMDLLLRKKFFHRAKKIPVSEQELKARSAKKKEKKKDKSEGEEDRKKEEAESSHAEEKKATKKRKIRLDMHLEQVFLDSNDAYVWIYEPIPYYYWLAGGALVLAVVALCLFPLWPPIVRKGVYYLSVGAAGFLMFILGLAVLRVLVFCLLWLVTLGRHHLWLFPNLTEDVGFFASFWPIWKYECKDKESSSKKNKKGRKEKEKHSDDENEEEGSGNEDNSAENNEDGQEKSETESEGSQQTGKDFEMIEKDDGN